MIAAVAIDLVPVRFKPLMICYKLTEDDRAAAYQCGLARDTSSTSKNHNPHTHGLKVSDEERLRLHVWGAAAELAAAKVLGIEWPASVDTFKSEPDLPPNWEVRRRSKMDWDVLVRSNDKNGQRIIHVVGDRSQYAVIGWLLVDDAKRDEYVKTYGNRDKAWFAPVSLLTPIGHSIWHPDHRIKDVESHVTAICQCGSKESVVVHARPGVTRRDCLKCGVFVDFVEFQRVSDE